MAYTSGDVARHLQKLAALVTQRRVALGIRSKEAAADACGLSHMTYRKVEGTRGVAPQRVSDATYAKIEVGLQIRAGACRAVAEGEADSIVLEDGTELIEGGQIRNAANSGRLEEEVDRAFDKSAQLTAPHLTLSEAKAMKEEMFRELRERGVLKSE
ncbi:MAG: hypothetical protein HOV82_16930 [Streptomyces sp.]|nr:hypothetical protein [Streptomyces sp.]NUP36224.1 hypothetical protein [Streptomyces sp.]NUS75571.1 hypothetical protein [Streptomyces sp.]